MPKIAKVSLTLALDDDPDWLVAFLVECGFDPDTSDNDLIHDAIVQQLTDSTEATSFLAEFEGDFEPITVEVVDE